MLVPEGSGAGDRARAALADLTRRAVIDPQGGAGAANGWLVAGGFARARVDVHDRDVMWANHQGGVQVRCPTCGGGLARELGGSPHPEQLVACPGCATVTRALALAYRPPVAWGPAALVLADVADSSLTPEGQAWADQALGPWKLVWRRVG